MFKSLINRLSNPKKRSYGDMPSAMLVALGATSFLIAGYFGMAMADVVPEYVKVANRIPLTQWGWTGWFLTVVLALMGTWIWHFGNVAFRCHTVLRDRWYT